MEPDKPKEEQRDAFKDLARKLAQVPKSEADEKEREYQKKRRARKPKRTRRAR